MHKKNRMIKGIALFLLLSGCFALLVNPVKHKLVSWMNQHYLKQELTLATVERNQQVASTFDYDSIENLDLKTIVKASQKIQDMPIVGKLVIPTAKIDMPIIKGVSNEGLAVGAVTLAPDQTMGEGNYTLAGNYLDNSNLLFGPLHQLKKGQKIYMTDLEMVYIYVMTSSLTVDSKEIPLWDEQIDEKMLTLITCNLTEQQRYVLRAKFIEKVPREGFLL
ncbi:MAG: class A sortase [Carnobacterium sp.]|uniref:class A sortase n=1 Tax=unclassified Carnobacterium TaxID=257487 RepID=UPI0019140E0E|nr:class A sortase [Carnobacterium sp. CS13]QQP69458.1 class A sortase [Carnobacterium sp. CS13]